MSNTSSVKQIVVDLIDRVDHLEKLVVLLARNQGSFVPEKKNPLFGRSIDLKVNEYLATLPRVSETMK